MTTIDRSQVLAYRAGAHGLQREVAAVAGLAVLDLGVQDTPPGSAAQALAARLPDPTDEPTRGPGIATTWSVRGAPHVHRADDLAPLSRALWPWSDADALARLDTGSSPVGDADLPARQALRLVAEEIAAIVDRPMPKGEVSTALTPRLPEALVSYCQPCDATHVVETLFRSAALPAGMRFDPDVRGVTFVPVPDWPGVPAEAEGEEGLIAAYLRLHGPARPEEVASFLGTTRSEVAERWPERTAEVDVDGQPRWIPEDAVSDLADPPPPPALRLLPPSDPWLQARDRDLVIPDRERQKEVWPSLARPGVVLAAGEVTGTWRARKKGRWLDLTIRPFSGFEAPDDLVQREADLLARARGTTGARVEVE